MTPDAPVRLRNAFIGACHCGNVSVHFETDRDPPDLPIRICACTFCAKHEPRYTSDPTGRVRIAAEDETALGRYSFGLRIGDFLFCRRCGVFAAAYMPAESQTDVARAVLNVRMFADADRFTAEPARMNYAGEDDDARRTRRERTWTPAALVLGRRP